MADLVTHICTGLLVGMGFGRGRAVLTAFGTVVPDLFSRVPAAVLDAIGGVPDLPYALSDIGHMPLGAALWCGLIAQGFEDRRQAFGWLVLGVALHFLLDVLQDHDGVGYRLLWPLTPTRFELGWIGSEATVVTALPLLGVTLMIWTLVERRRVAKAR